MTRDELKAEIAAGDIDTVLLALTDMQGRLQGKRLAGAVVPAIGGRPRRGGLQLPARGRRRDEHRRRLRDVELGARLRRLRHEARLRHALSDDLGSTAPRCASPTSSRRTARRWSPRRVRSCARQLARLAERGWAAHAGTELEFMIFDDSYEQAWDSAYRGLTPANRYNVDYSMLGTARVEPLLRRIRNAMMDAGMVVEDSKGECNFGQHEINFLLRRGAAGRGSARGSTRTPPRRSPPRTARRSPSWPSSTSARATRATCTCHCAGPTARSCSTRRRGCSTASSPACSRGLREITLFLAPNINSYKRYAALSFAPTTVAWGHDNRTCALRVVGHGAGRRIECRVPGGRVNPYLAISALIAAGLHGVDAELELEPASRATPTRRPSVRRSRDAARCRDLFASSAIARDALARRSSTTTSTTRASSSRPTTPRSRIGSASGASSVCRRSVVRAAQILQQGAQARGDRVHLLARPADRLLEARRSASPIPANGATRAVVGATRISSPDP